MSGINQTYIKWTDAERTLVASTIRGLLIAAHLEATESNVRSMWISAQSKLRTDGLLDEGRVRTSSSPKDLADAINRINAVPNPVTLLTKAVEAYKAEFGPDADPFADGRKWREDQAWRRPTNVVVKHNPAPAVPASNTKVKPKFKATIMGVHSKHWPKIEGDCPGAELIFIDQHVADHVIKQKCSARPVVIFETGCSPHMVRLAKAVAADHYVAGGITSVIYGVRHLQERAQKAVTA